MKSNPFYFLSSSLSAFDLASDGSVLERMSAIVDLTTLHAHVFGDLDQHLVALQHLDDLADDAARGDDHVAALDVGDQRVRLHPLLLRAKDQEVHDRDDRHERHELDEESAAPPGAAAPWAKAGEMNMGGRVPLTLSRGGELRADYSQAQSQCNQASTANARSGPSPASGSQGHDRRTQPTGPSRAHRAALERLAPAPIPHRPGARPKASFGTRKPCACRHWPRSPACRLRC